MYAKAFLNLRNDPGTFANRLYDGAAIFTLNLPAILMQGYMLAPPPPWFLQYLFLLSCVFGATYVLFARRRKGEVEFWFLLLVGTVASAAVVYFDDGRRVLVASYPLLGLLLTMGLVGPRASRRGLSPNRRVARDSLGLAVLTLLGSLVLPAVAKRIAGTDQGTSSSASGPVANQHVVYGGRRLSGVLVVADGTSSGLDTAAIPLSAFKAIIGASNVEFYQGLVTPEAPPTPFGFVTGMRTEKGSRSGYMYIVPADVVRRSNVARWRFTVADWQVKPGNSRYWYHVTRADPEE